MSDPRSAQQPTEEEMRAYLQAVREADVTQLVTQAYSLLGTGAEVKLGRPDARPLIDGLAALVEATARALPSDLVERMRQQIGQLQVAQVQLEQEAAEQSAAEGEAAGAADQGPPAPGAAPGQPASGPAAGQPGQPGSQERKMTDRLWVPGRDAPPGR